MEIHEVLVLKHDGRVERFRVSDGDIAQAEFRASLCQRPGDSLVVVTEHAYIRTTGLFSVAADDVMTSSSSRSTTP